MAKRGQILAGSARAAKKLECSCCGAFSERSLCQQCGHAGCEEKKKGERCRLQVMGPGKGPGINIGGAAPIAVPPLTKREVHP